ncbi:hypothetical protein ABFS82_02G011200 [Erythranthe guttata]|nr:PREDICTED: dirigent protein 4-like [Erythranthe guttata]|eukprot:XP_012836818.1 PREDICTED: dirigent protein 4-like [Erythranthe guttata]
MEKIVLLTWIMVLATPVYCKYYSKSVPYEPVRLQKTNLRFYLHDILSGPNPTAVPIVRPNQFGALVAIDDPLTEGPEITSKKIGNARGMYILASQGTDLTLVLYVDLGFTTGEFNGSSLSVLSRNPILENPREMAVVGGRGRFRQASGFITVKTQYLNTTTGDAVLEYNVEVVHP